MFRARGKRVQMTGTQSEFRCETAEETRALGNSLGRHLKAGDVVLLSGQLGAGKTVVARGIAEALGAPRWRGSPTFNLVHEYPTIPLLFHADLYRLSRAEVEAVGLEEYAQEDSILLIEWPERNLEYVSRLSENRLHRVSIESEPGGSRAFRVSTDGAHGEIPGT